MARVIIVLIVSFTVVYVTTKVCNTIQKIYQKILLFYKRIFYHTLLDKKVKLATYAAKCIDNELLMKFRTRKKITKEISLYEPIGTDKEGNSINMLDVTCTEQIDVVEQMSVSEDVSKLSKYVSSVLKGREQEIIIMRYGLFGTKEMTQREIGKKLDISRSYVSRIEKKALKKLRDAFDNKG